MNLRKLNESMAEILNEIEQKAFVVYLKDDERPFHTYYDVDAEAVKEKLLSKYAELEIDRIEELEEDHEEVTEDFMAIGQSQEGPDFSGTVKFIPGYYGYYYQTGDKDLDDNKNLPQWSTIRTIDGIRNWFRNVLFEYGAKEVTIGRHHWNIADFQEAAIEYRLYFDGEPQGQFTEKELCDRANEIIAEYNDGIEDRRERLSKCHDIEDVKIAMEGLGWEIK